MQVIVALLVIQASMIRPIFHALVDEPKLKAYAFDLMFHRPPGRTRE